MSVRARSTCGLDKRGVITLRQKLSRGQVAARLAKKHWALKVDAQAPRKAAMVSSPGIYGLLLKSLEAPTVFFSSSGPRARRTSRRMIL
jgi:hypothetical protein